MLLFGALLLVLWTVTGSNDWLEVYGMPALCGYQNLSQDFGPPATTSLAILYWFLLRGWAFSWTVLFPHHSKLPWILKALSTNFWLGKICDFFEKCCKQSASQLRQRQKRLQEATDTQNNSRQSSLIKTTTLIRPRVAQGFWIFLSGTSVMLLGVVYAAFEVWGSYAFNLAWTCYTLAGSVQIVSGLRNTASYNGMNGSESQWSFGQQLPLLLLILPTFAMIEMFFEDPDEETKSISSAGPQVTPRYSTSSGHTLSHNDNSSTASSGSATNMESSAPEGYMLRRRIDTEQRVGMDISDARAGHAVSTSSVLTHDQESASSPESVTADEEQRPISFISRQVEFSATGKLNEKLWDLRLFKFYVFLNFVLFSYIMVSYGI